MAKHNVVSFYDYMPPYTKAVRRDESAQVIILPMIRTEPPRRPSANLRGSHRKLPPVFVVDVVKPCDS